MQYANCVAGGLSTTVNSYPYSANTSLGNTADGFYLYNSSRVLISNCSSRRNLRGLVNDGSTDIRINGGVFADNLGSGLIFGTNIDARSSRVSGGPVLSGNGSSLTINSINYSVPGVVSPPAIPSSGAGLYNPFPFDATVYIYSGVVQGVSIYGQSIYGIVSGSFRLPAGTYIQLYYTSPPAWTWFID